MIENKTLNIKIIFKNIKNMLKILHVLKQIFVMQNIKEWFSKSVLKNCFKKIVIKQRIHFLYVTFPFI